MSASGHSPGAVSSHPARHCMHRDGSPGHGREVSAIASHVAHGEGSAHRSLATALGSRLLPARSPALSGVPSLEVSDSLFRLRNTSFAFTALRHAGPW